MILRRLKTGSPVAFVSRVDLELSARRKIGKLGKALEANSRTNKKVNPHVVNSEIRTRATLSPFSPILLHGTNLVPTLFNNYPAKSRGISFDTYRRGRRPSWLNQGIFRKIEQDNCFIIQQIPIDYHFQNEKNYGSMIKTLKASNT